ncbi:MAG: isochorismatase family protein [Aliifodinibius sp.]|nr:isochorismatase family protein [Fodinibius sp.]
MSFPFIPDQNVEVPEIPFEDKIELPTQKTAVVIVDMQNDFVKPEGSLLVEAAKDTIPNIEKVLNNVRKENMPIAYTQDTHFEGDREWEIWPEHCRRESKGWHIIDELKPQKGDVVCEKNRYDGFYGTWLEHYLSHIWNVEHLVIMGTVSNICVLHTAASAGLRWFHIVVPANGISALSEFDQAATLRQVSSLYGGHVVKSVDDIRFK